MGRPLLDISGERFGRLVAKRADIRRTSRTVVYWHCRCDCGSATLVRLSHLRDGNVKSCGCLKYELACTRLAKYRVTTHAMSDTPEYRIWAAIKTRCYNPNHSKYERYGGRGIGMAEHWRTDFAAFYRDVGQRPSPKHSIDRWPNSDGNYEPGNVRWSLQSDQMNNVARNRVVTYRGQRMTITQAARVADVVHPNVANSRMRNGWSVAAAVETPLKFTWSTSVSPPSRLHIENRTRSQRSKRR